MQADKSIASNSANASGNVLALRSEQYLNRSVGLIQTIEDICNIILKKVGGAPVFVRDVAEAKIGAAVRQGANIRGGCGWYCHDVAWG